MIASATVNERCDICGSKQHERVTKKRGWDIRACSECELYFVSPQPTDEELAAIYSTGDGYFARAGKKLEDTPDDRAELLHRTFTGLGMEPGRFIDIGCANGNIPFHMRARGWEVAGNDLNEGALEIARAHEIDARRGQLAECGFEDASFDAANLGDLIEHVRSPRALMEEVARILKPGGLAVVVTPNARSGFGRASLALAKRAGISWAHSQAPYHLYEFTAENLTRLLEDVGFEHVETTATGSGSFPYLVGATGYFDELKNELKGSGGYRVTPGVVRAAPKLAAVTGTLFPLWLYGRLTDGPSGEGRIIRTVVRRRA